MQRRGVVEAALLGGASGGDVTDRDRSALPGWRLGFLIGEWEGAGWFRVGPDHVRTFQQTEVVRSHLDGEVLTVEGRGKDEADGHVVHRAFAVVSVDHETGRYRWDAHVPGASTSTEMTIDDTGFSWLSVNQNPATSIRFRIDVEQRTWRETGDVVEHGVPQSRMLEMTLHQRG